jgi:hypothetical protein
MILEIDYHAIHNNPLEIHIYHYQISIRAVNYTPLLRQEVREFYINDSQVLIEICPNKIVTIKIHTRGSVFGIIRCRNELELI